MGYILEETSHPTLDNVSISVDEHAKDECTEPWHIITLDTDFAEIRTPHDLIELGKWLVINGKRIKKEYTPKGKKRKTKI